MSVFISVAAPEAACLLTDAATYDDAGVIHKIEAKVWTARTAPLAVTARGHAEGGEMFAKSICELADREGVAAAIDSLQQFADSIQEIAQGRFDGENVVQVIVAAYLPNVGGVHRSFCTMSHAISHDQPAYRVYEPPSVFATGPFTTSEELRAAGVAARSPDEAMTEYLRRAGADILEFMRKRPDRRFGTLETNFFGIGGRCDLTVIDAAGARTETLRVWDDKIGQSVDPFKLSSTVTAMNTFPTPSRRERRAARHHARM